MSLENLRLLEAKIDAFVGQHERVRSQHEALAQRLKEKDEQLAQLSAQLKQFEQERNEVRSRLEKLLKRLDGLDLG